MDESINHIYNHIYFILNIKKLRKKFADVQKLMYLCTKFQNLCNETRN